LTQHAAGERRRPRPPGGGGPRRRRHVGRRRRRRRRRRQRRGGLRGRRRRRRRGVRAGAGAVGHGLLRRDRPAGRGRFPPGSPLACASRLRSRAIRAGYVCAPSGLRPVRAKRTPGSHPPAVSARAAFDRCWSGVGPVFELQPTSNRLQPARRRVQPTHPAPASRRPRAPATFREGLLRSRAAPGLLGRGGRLAPHFRPIAADSGLVPIGLPLARAPPPTSPGSRIRPAPGGCPGLARFACATCAPAARPSAPSSWWRIGFALAPGFTPDLHLIYA
jgi:hypothetical protein